MTSAGNQETEAHSMDTLEQIRQEAIDWLIRLDEPLHEGEDEVPFSEWLARSPAHGEVFQQVSLIWSGNAVAEVAGRMHAEREAPRSVARSRRWMAWAAPALAASVLLAVMVWQSPWGLRWTADEWVATGERRHVLLEDGSQVTLNTASGLVNRFSARQREVELLQGEAFFQVVADPTRPFTVRVGDTQVRVLGTAFNVRYVRDALDVSVRQGHVEVLGEGGQRVALQAGDQVRVDRLGISDVHATTDETLAWLDGRLIFDNRPLQEVLQELQRYHPGLLLMVDRDLGQLKVTGNYQLDDPQRVLESLAEVLGIRLVRLGSWLMLLG